MVVVDKSYPVRILYSRFTDACIHGFQAAKTADLILVMLDATKSDEQKRLLEIELDAVGIRLNKKKPDVIFKKRTTGGVCLFISVDSLFSKMTLQITFNSTVKLTKTDEKTIRTILAGCNSFSRHQTITLLIYSFQINFTIATS